METTYSHAVALAVPVFISLIVVEFAVDRYRGTRYYHLADAINNLSCGIVSTGMRVFFGFLGLFAYEWLLSHAAIVRLSADRWFTWVFAFVFYDLCYYWQHRLGHTVGLFWATHSVHHQSEEFNLSTALRQPGTGAFTMWIFYVPMALCGIPVSVFLLTGVAQLFYQFWPHTRHIGRLGVLDRWIQTPSNHRVHHAQNDIYLDRNYVGVFLLWDHLFGTFQEERDDEPCIYGVRGQLKSWNPVWANLHYWWIMAQDCRHAKSWLDKLRVWVAPPGWRPPDVAARFPKTSYDPYRDFSRYDPPRNLLLSIYVSAQFLAILAANSHFLKLLATEGNWWNAAYFVFILGSLFCLGGVLESRRTFILLEAARMTGVVVAAGIGNAWFGGVHASSVTGVIATFAAASCGLLWIATRKTWVADPQRAAAEAAGS